MDFYIKNKWKLGLYELKASYFNFYKIKVLNVFIYGVLCKNIHNKTLFVCVKDFL
jgi:hypothetical protein